MYSTTTIVKNSKLNGRLIGTHQQLDLAARKLLGRQLLKGQSFPSGKEIIHFEGTRGPDGLKRKSPGEDEPSHMAKGDEDLADFGPGNQAGHEKLDERSLLTMIFDHRWNLVQALKAGDNVRAAFEAAWMAHMITDDLTPAHHFPLHEFKDELMTDKEMFKVFGAPIKGVVHGRNILETMRNNWLYWGAKGPMSQHVAYEYGVAMIAATMPERAMIPDFKKEKFSGISLETALQTALGEIQERKMYEHFQKDGWTTDLALETRGFLLPKIVECITLGWYSAAEEAYAKK